MTNFINTEFVDYQLEEKINQKSATIDFNWDQKKYLQALSFELRLDPNSISESFLDKTRTACQLWDVDLRAQNITSHRKFIGPVIVYAKKLIAPVIKFFLKDFIRQQKDFNAAILALVLEGKNKK